MPVTIEQSVVIAIDGDASWKVPLENIKTHHEKRFVRLRSRECALIRMVCCNFIALPKRARFSLLHTAGWTKLMTLRNADAFTKTQPTVEESFFGIVQADASTDKRKRQPSRFKAEQLQELRRTPDLMHVFIPGPGPRGGLEVAMLKPAHPTDDVWIELDEDTIMHVIEFLRVDLEVESLTTCRPYSHEGERAKHMASARIVGTLHGDGEDDAFRTPPKKSRTLHHEVPAPLVDARDSRVAREEVEATVCEASAMVACA